MYYQLVIYVIFLIICILTSTFTADGLGRTQETRICAPPCFVLKHHSRVSVLKVLIVHNIHNVFTNLRLSLPPKQSPKLDRARPARGHLQIHANYSSIFCFIILLLGSMHIKLASSNISATRVCIIHTTYILLCILLVLNKHTLVHDVNRLSTLTHAKESIIRVCKFSFDSHRLSHDLVCNLSPADSKSKSF